MAAATAGLRLVDAAQPDRCQSGDERRRNRHRDREGKHADVERDLLRARDEAAMRRGDDPRAVFDAWEDVGV